MPTHLFQVGAVVNLLRVWPPNPTGSRYVVEAQMPPLGTVLQYRLKSEDEGFSRVAAEHLLSAVEPSPVLTS